MCVRYDHQLIGRRQRDEAPEAVQHRAWRAHHRNRCHVLQRHRAERHDILLERAIRPGNKDSSVPTPTRTVRASDRVEWVLPSRTEPASVRVVHPSTISGGCAPTGPTLVRVARVARLTFAFTM